MPLNPQMLAAMLRQTNPPVRPAAMGPPPPQQRRALPSPQGAMPAMPPLGMPPAPATQGPGQNRIGGPFGGNPVRAPRQGKPGDW